jgi:hypothetical protein
VLRKKLFFLCLTNNEDSLRHFSNRIGVSPATVSFFLSGRTKSERIRKEVDSYIAKNLQKVKDLLSDIENAA